MAHHRSQLRRAGPSRNVPEQSFKPAGGTGNRYAAMGQFTHHYFNHLMRRGKRRSKSNTAAQSDRTIPLHRNAINVTFKPP